MLQSRPSIQLIVVLVLAVTAIPGAARAQAIPTFSRFVHGAGGTHLHGLSFRSGLRTVYATNADNSTVYRWDGFLDAADGSTTSATHSFPVASGTQGIEFDNATGFIYVIAGTDVHVYDQAGYELESFSPFGGTTPSDIDLVGGLLYVVEAAPGDRVRAFARTVPVASSLALHKTVITPGMHHYHGQAYDPLLDRLWGTEYENNVLLRYDGVARAVDGATISSSQTLSPANSRGDLQDAEFDEVQRLIYVVMSGGYVQVFDPNGGFVEEWGGHPSYTRAVAAHNGSIWLGRDDGTVTRWQRNGIGSYTALPGFTIPATVNGGGAPTLAYDSDRDLIWVNYWDGKAWVAFDSVSGQQLVTHAGPGAGSGYGHDAEMADGFLLEGTETMEPDRLKWLRIGGAGSWTQVLEWTLPQSFDWPGIAYDADRDVLWLNAWNAGIPDSFRGFDPDTGTPIGVYAAPPGLPAWGHGLDYAEGQLLLSTETASVDGMLVFTLVDDDDGDGIANMIDNCPDSSNTDQNDFDGTDGGDACDLDDDNDGDPDSTDCAPFDPTQGALATEFCDFIDSNCDLDLVDSFLNSDSDGIPDCVDDDDDGDGEDDGTDCNDQDASVHSGASESCDGIDSDCDLNFVDGFPDFDLDLSPDCIDPDDDADFDLDGSDCDDGNEEVYTGAPELCDFVDSDCDGSIVDGELDGDGDLMPDCVDEDDDGDGEDDLSDCDPLDASIYPFAPEACDLIDSDCNGSILDGNPDTDGDGLPDCVDDDDDADGDLDASDCEDGNPNAYTGAPEDCDLLDSDCDGDLIDGFADTDGDWEPDCTDGDDDGDGHADELDCDDLEAATFPGAVESCDGIDSDCNGSLVDGYVDTDGDLMPDCVDEDDDGDNDPDLSDCEDLDSTIFGGATELCDGVDSDCDLSLVDEFGDEDLDLSPDCVDEDDDGDGALDLADCAPLDASVFPGAPEGCDAVDSDCDGSIVDGDLEADGDGVPDCVDEDDDGDGALDAADCASLDASIFPGATDLCDSIDSDCDGDLIDGFLNSDGDELADCADLDDDDDGDPDATDCADTDPFISAGTAELCDGIDQDCDGTTVDEGFDSDSDGVADCLDADDDNDGEDDENDCAIADATIYPGASELCDFIDSDCDGSIVDEDSDFDLDGEPDCIDEDDDDDGDPDSSDCASLDPSRNASALEICDGIDQNCDGGTADEGADLDSDGEADCFDLDDDGDGVEDALDCEPGDSEISASATELCDGIDSNCDGSLADSFPNSDGDPFPDCIDPDDDGDGEADITDCADMDPTIHSGAPELCDGIDQDCDGTTEDEGSDNDGDGVADCLDEDDDNDGTPDSLDCGIADPNVHPGATELCDAIDSGCDLSLVDEFFDTDGDGEPDCIDLDDDGDGDPDGTDCEDLDAGIHHGASETCDGIDQNCEGGTDDEGDDGDGDDLADCVDEDDDDDGDLDAVDCAPNDAAIGPSQPEICDAIDADCDGDLVDGDVDTDGDLVPDCVDADDDGDRISDVDEAVIGSDPLNPDTDGDGIEDGAEGIADSDGDGIPDLLDADAEGGCACGILGSGESSGTLAGFALFALGMLRARRLCRAAPAPWQGKEPATFVP